MRGRTPAARCGAGQSRLAAFLADNSDRAACDGLLAERAVKRIVERGPGVLSIEFAQSRQAPPVSRVSGGFFHDRWITFLVVGKRGAADRGTSAATAQVTAVSVIGIALAGFFCSLPLPSGKT